MSLYSSVNDSIEMPTPKTSTPTIFPEKMPRRLVSSEHKPQPYTKAKSTKVPKLPALNRSFSQEQTPLDSATQNKKTISNSFTTEFTSSVIDSTMLSTSMCDLSKHNTTAKKVKRRLNMDEKANACSSSSLNDTPPDPNSPKDPWSESYKPGCGTPSTLQDQTKQFIAETLQSPTPEIDVNLIERSLGMPKRRVYDILGVLEGVGWVKKSEKNKYVWLNEVAMCMEAARKKVIALDKETSQVDENIMKAERYLTELFCEDPSPREEITQIREHLYLTEEDFAQTEDLTKNSLIAVRTNNPNLRVEVPETKEGYELIIQTEGAPIEAYTLSPDGSFTSIADSTYNTYGNLSTNPYSHNFDPFLQDFLRTSDNDYESSDYPYSQFSNSFDDIYTPNNFSLSELFEFGPRISQTHV